jgi:hypothetical protein
MHRVATILAWLLAAPAVLAGPREALAASLADARALPALVAQQQLYLDMSDLPAGYRIEAARVIDFHANQLSRNPLLVPARRVYPTPHPTALLLGPQQLVFGAYGAIRIAAPDLLALNVVTYGYSTAAREKLAVVDPYFHQLIPWPGGVWPKDGRHYAAGTFRYAVPGFWLDQQQSAELALRTNSAAPLVRASWWLAQTSRQIGTNGKENGIGYYDFLGLKKRADFEKLVKVSDRDSVEFGREIMAAIDRSGISEQNRQVLRLQGLAGGAWRTFDTDDSTGRGNAIRNLKRGDYDHKAERHFAVLSNGLLAMLLCAADGTLQAVAPDFVGQNHGTLQRGTDMRIHTGRCWECHVEGLKQIDDWARRNLKQPLRLDAVLPADVEILRRQYFSDLRKNLERDNAIFAEAVKEITGGWTTQETARAYARLYYGYLLRDRDLADIAHEMGVVPDRLRAALATEGFPPPVGVGRLDAVLAGLLTEGTARVEMIEELQGELWRIFLLRSK